MGIRETINKQPMIATGVTIGIIVLTLVFIIVQLSGGSRSNVKIPTQAFFTIDDGASYFSDDVSKIAPYTYSGQTAVKAYVFKSSNGKKFVGYLERYTPTAQKAIENSRLHPEQDPGIVNMAMENGVEVKAPLTGDKGWVKTSSPASQKVLNPVSPDGSAGPPEFVIP